MNSMMSDDASDLSAALAGNPEAFARLYDRHAPVVLSLCRRSSSLADAEDAMQETFLRAYRKLHQLDRPAGLGLSRSGFYKLLAGARQRLASLMLETRAT
jgi:hypothetical protein